MTAAKKKVAAKKAPARKSRAKVTPITAAKSATRRRAQEAPEARRAPSPQPARRRAILEAPGIPAAASDYFADTVKEGVTFVGTGCTLIDAVVGGGWALRRVVNIVGDKSAGKTLLAIEACANFDRQYPGGYIRYAEAEAAFDQRYAEALGLPEGKVDFEAGDPEKGINTVEDFFEDIERVLDAHRDQPILYILDSLDALSDAAEAGRDMDEGSYGAQKAKKMGELFRRLVRRIEEQDCLLIIISQLRDKIGVTFGEKQTRSGGRALDFYASQVVWLAEIGKIVKEMPSGGGSVADSVRRGPQDKKPPRGATITRVVGVDVRLKVKKNKVGLPFRECEYPVIFGYGVDDITANVQWLLDSGCEDRLAEVGMSKAGWRIRSANLRNKGGDVAREVRDQLDLIVREEWKRIEKKFLPQSRKY